MSLRFPETEELGGSAKKEKKNRRRNVRKKKIHVYTMVSRNIHCVTFRDLADEFPVGTDHRAAIGRVRTFLFAAVKDFWGAVNFGHAAGDHHGPCA